jgi:hypothetical protein
MDLNILVDEKRRTGHRKAAYNVSIRLPGCGSSAESGFPILLNLRVSETRGDGKKVAWQKLAAPHGTLPSPISGRYNRPQRGETKGHVG